MKNFARIENNKVVELLSAESLPEFHPSLVWEECGEGVEVGWSFDDGTFTAPAVPTQDQLIAAASEDVRLALQKAIDAQAVILGFSGGNALMLYAGFENAFQPMAQAFATWEASVWVEAGAYKAQVLLGNQPMLLAEAAVAMMPELVMP